MITSRAHRTPYLITEGEQMSSFIKRMPSSEETIQHRISELLEPEMKKFCLQKVVRSLPCYIWFTLSWSWFKLKKRTAHVFIYLHNGCHIPTTVTVVGCTEHCDHILILHPIPTKSRYQFTLTDKTKPLLWVACLVVPLGIKRMWIKHELKDDATYMVHLKSSKHEGFELIRNLEIGIKLHWIDAYN